MLDNLGLTHTEKASNQLKEKIPVKPGIDSLMAWYASACNKE